MSQNRNERSPVLITASAKNSSNNVYSSLFKPDGAAKPAKPSVTSLSDDEFTKMLSDLMPKDPAISAFFTSASNNARTRTQNIIDTTFQLAEQLEAICKPV